MAPAGALSSVLRGHAEDKGSSLPGPEGGAVGSAAWICRAGDAVLLLKSLALLPLLMLLVLPSLLVREAGEGVAACVSLQCGPANNWQGSMGEV